MNANDLQQEVNQDWSYLLSDLKTTHLPTVPFRAIRVLRTSHDHSIRRSGGVDRNCQDLDRRWVGFFYLWHYYRMKVQLPPQVHSV